MAYLTIDKHPRFAYLPRPNKGGSMAKKKKEETIEDIIDRIEEDLQTIRDKASEDQWDDEVEDEDEEDED